MALMLTLLSHISDKLIRNQVNTKNIANKVQQDLNQVAKASLQEASSQLGDERTNF